MKTFKPLITVAASALLFCFLGGIIGISLAHFAPGYYRGVFMNGNSPDFDPIQVGFGLGLTQGFTGGIFIGLFIVLIQENPALQFVEKAKRFLYKYKRLLLVTSSVLVIIIVFLGWQLNKFGNALLAFQYTSYISGEYMPAQRRLTKEWPTDLSNLPQYVKLEEYRTGITERLNDVLEFHRDAFEKFEPIHSDRERCTYRLYLRGYVVRCESIVNKSGFDEGNCTYEQE